MAQGFFFEPFHFRNPFRISPLGFCIFRALHELAEVKLLAFQRSDLTHDTHFGRISHSNYGVAGVDKISLSTSP